ncbi:MAG: hypothetical protein WBG08_02885 [Litorimonas sp.]
MKDLFLILRDTIGPNPSLWAVVILLVWFLASIASRAFLITSRQSIVEDIETQFSLETPGKVRFDKAMDETLELHAASKVVGENGKPWSLAEITRAYWLFKLTGYTMKVCFAATAFWFVAILIFNRAGVREEEGSISAVIVQLGNFSALVLLVLFALSVLKIQFALHTLPIPSLRNVKKSITAFLLW